VVFQGLAVNELEKITKNKQNGLFYRTIMVRR